MAQHPANLALRFLLELAADDCAFVEFSGFDLDLRTVNGFKLESLNQV